MSAKYVYVMKELNKTWPGGKQVIKDGWLSFYPGAKIGVLGSNGAGKSTLLKIMAGLDKEFSGEAWSAENIKVGYLAQEPILDKDLNVHENIMLGISDLKNTIINTLDSNKAIDVITIDLKNKSSMADYMIIASGTSSRHIQALSEQVLEQLKTNGIINSKIEGKESSDWKLVDGIDLIVHIFHPEKRKFYELEKIWSELIPKEKIII